MKRMKSKDHGFMHVYNLTEENDARKHGWVEESELFPGEVAEPVAVEAAEADEAPARGKPGPKPKAK